MPWLPGHFSASGRQFPANVANRWVGDGQGYYGSRSVVNAALHQRCQRFSVASLRLRCGLAMRRQSLQKNSRRRKFRCLLLLFPTAPKNPLFSGASSWTICEPFLAINLSLMRCNLGIPTPFPAVGIPSDLKPPCVHLCFVGVWTLCATPDFGRFMARAAAVIEQLSPRSPKTSLVAHAPPTGSPTDGLHGLKDSVL